MLIIIQLRPPLQIVCEFKLDLKVIGKKEIKVHTTLVMGISKQVWINRLICCYRKFIGNSDHPKNFGHYTYCTFINKKIIPPKQRIPPTYPIFFQTVAGNNQFLF